MMTTEGATGSLAGGYKLFIIAGLAAVYAGTLFSAAKAPPSRTTAAKAQTKTESPASSIEARPVGVAPARQTKEETARAPRPTKRVRTRSS